MFISAKKIKSKMLKAALIYLGISLFCGIFSLIYSLYSHSVSSIYMTFMFAYPLAGGTIVCLLIAIIPRAQVPGHFVTNIYNSGIAALVVGSMLRGIFDIAGTSSVYQPAFVIVGILMTLIAAACYIKPHTQF